MRGSSGAKFEWVDTGTVRKLGIGNGRVLEQGMWLEENRAPSLPTVYGTGEVLGEDEYSMEALHPIAIEHLDTRSIIAATVDMLTRDIWSKAAVVSLERRQHVARYEPLRQFIGPADDHLMKAAFEKIKWGDLTSVLTHGDPIIDNLMLREGDYEADQIVIIDPIPATPAIPDLKCVDLGRLLQSAVGYEHIRYDLHGPAMQHPSWFVSLYCDSDEEAKATLYFGAFHLMRSMMYVDKMTTERIGDICLRPVLEELSWML